MKWWKKILWGLGVWGAYSLLAIFLEFSAWPLVGILTLSIFIYKNQPSILPLFTASILIDWTFFSAWPIFTLAALLIWLVFKSIENLTKRWTELWIKFITTIILNLLWLGILEVLTWLINNRQPVFKTDLYLSWFIFVVLGNVILYFIFAKKLNEKF